MRKRKKDLTKKLTNLAMLGVLLLNTFVAPISALAETTTFDHYKTEDTSTASSEQVEKTEETSTSSTEDEVKVQITTEEVIKPDESSNNQTANANDSPEELPKNEEVSLTELQKMTTEQLLERTDIYDVKGLTDEQIIGLAQEIYKDQAMLDENFRLEVTNDKGEVLDIPFERDIMPRAFASRATGVESSLVNTNFKVKHNGSWVAYGSSLHKYTINGVLSYCVQPHIAFVPGGGFVQTSPQQFKGLTNAQKLAINNAMNFGATIKDSNSYIAATQLYIWSLVADHVETDLPNYKSDVAKIKANEKNFKTAPSFHNKTYTIKVGETLKLTDTNKVLSNYKMKDNRGTTAVISGNTLSITPNKNSTNGGVSMTRTSPATGSQYFWVKPGAQVVSTAGALDPTNGIVKINVLKQGNFVLDKLDENNKPLQGVKFNIKVGNQPVKEYTTNAQGKITIKDLDIDTKVEYEETQTVKNYYIDKDTYKGSVVIKGNQDNVVKVKNPRAYGSVSVEKQDAETGEKAQSTASLVGGEYTLYNDAKELVEVKKTGDNRKATFDKLEVGTYFIKETKAPNGYYLDDPTEYEVKVTHEDKFDNFLTSEIVQTSEKGKNPTALFKNHPQRGDFELIKVDEKGKPMENVKFDIVTKVPNGATSEKKTYVTDKNGKITIEKLLLDTVVEYEEIETHVNYYIDKATYKGSVTVKPDTTNSITVKNPRAYGSFEIEKQDKETNTKPQGDATLVGGEYTLYDENMKAIETKKTDENRKTGFEKLSVGTYFVKETKAPTGYNLDAPLFTVKVTQPDKYSPLLTTAIYDETGKEISKATSGASTIFFNTVIRGDVELKKWADADWKNDIKNIIALKDAVFSMFDKDGKKVDEQTTDANGVLTFKNHPYGDYTVKELKAPEGYMIVAKDMKVEIRENKQTYHLEAMNAVEGGFVRVVKADDETKKPIFKGAQFKIKNLQTGKLKTWVDNSGKESDIWETNAEGYFTTPTTFLYGEYELYEHKAPYGYTKSDQVVKFKVEGDNKETVIPLQYENTRVKGTLVFEKRGEYATGTKDKATPTKKPSEIVYEEDFKEHEENSQKVQNDYTEEQNKLIKEAEDKYGVAVDLTPTMELGIEATYGIFAREDIILQEGTLVHKKDARVGTVKTDKNGKGKFEQLELGKYYLVEEEAQDGFLIDKKPINFEIKYGGEEVEVTTTTAKAVDKYHRTSIRLHKAQEVTVDVDAKNDKDDNAKRKEAEEQSNAYYSEGEKPEEPEAPEEPEEPVIEPMMAKDSTEEETSTEETTEDGEDAEEPVLPEFNKPRNNVLLDYDNVRGHGTPKIELEKGQGQVFGLFADEDIINHATGKVLIKKDTPLGYSIVKDGIASWDDLFLPAGNYYSREVVQVQNYKPYDEIHKFKVDNKGNFEEYKVTITGEGFDVKYGEGEDFLEYDIDKAIRNEVEEIEIQTTMEEEMGTQIWYSSGRVRGFDYVTYKNVKVDGTPYTQSAQLHFEDGEPIFDINGEPVMSEVTFVPITPNGVVAVPFDVEVPNAIKNVRFVAFEDLYEGIEKRRVAVHHDLNDINQFGRFVDTRIKTQATNIDGNKFINPAKDQQLRDEVSVDDAIVGGQYKLTAKYVEFKTGEELLEAPLEFEEEFTAEKSNFIYNMNTSFDATGLNGKKGVFLEKLYYFNPVTEDWEFVTSHEDLNDESQAIQIVEPEIHTEFFWLDPTNKESKEIDPLSKVKGYDRVYYKNLISGNEYTFDMVLHDPETGKDFLDADGKPVMGQQTIIAGQDGEVTEVIKASDYYNGKGYETDEKEEEPNSDKEESNKEEDGKVEENEDSKEPSKDSAKEEKVTAKKSNKGTPKSEEPTKDEETSETDEEETEEVEETDETAGMTEFEKDQYLKRTQRLQELRKEEQFSEIVDVELVKGYVDVPFEGNFSKANDKIVVAFETLSFNDTPITTEEDPENPDQTGKVRNPKIQTKALVNGTKEVTTDGKLELEDTVIYEDLTPGVEYTQVVEWMEKSTGKPLTLNGKAVTSEIKFTPKEPNGEVVVKSTVDNASEIFKLYGTSVELVAFEETLRNKELITEHKDINDKGQTVKIKQPARPSIPKTGGNENSNMLMYVIALITLTVFGAVYYVYKRKQVKSN